MNRADWLQWRRKGLGGSDVAGVLGLSPWSSPMSVWWSKVRDLEDEPDPVKERGRLLEDAVLLWAKAELGSALVKGVGITHPDLGWARGTPDAWTDVDEGLEAKTTQFFDEEDGWGEGTDQVPLHVRIQCQWYTAISGAKIWRVAALSMMQSEFRLYELHPEPDVHERLFQVAGDFWRDHVVADVPPDLDTSGATSAYLRERYADPFDQVLDANGDGLELLRTYALAKNNQQVLAGYVDELAMRLKTRIGCYRGLQDFDGLRATWSRFPRARTDLKQLRKDRPDLVEVLDQYTRTKPSDRLLVTRRKRSR